uniref:Uncharacterized protein n=1 Tax=viral metagenome TaxID=1070528 RepID=A0A6C0BN97_9ZZZZ
MILDLPDILQEVLLYVDLCDARQLLLLCKGQDVNLRSIYRRLTWIWIKPYYPKYIPIYNLPFSIRRDIYERKDHGAHFKGPAKVWWNVSFEEEDFIMGATLFNETTGSIYRFYVKQPQKSLVYWSDSGASQA